MAPIRLSEWVKADVWCVVFVHNCTQKHSRHGKAFDIRLTVSVLLSA